MKKKFILRVMAWLLAVAMLLPSAGNLFTAYAEEGKVAYSGKVEIQGVSAEWWNTANPTLKELLGDVAPEDVVKIVFYSDTAFLPGYNTANTGGWAQPADFVKELVADDIWLGEGYALQIGVSIAPGSSATVCWDVYVDADADYEAETPKTEASASGDLVINFADLKAGGYGYEATVNGGAVDVSIASQYQEIQYVLPEVVDLAAYTTLIVDVTSNAQLDIKLVNPEAEINQYSQKTPFRDYYTAAEAITAPISIDLADYADKDLSQINFMAMGNDTKFTIKSITFVGAAPKATATPKPTATPTPTLVPVTEETYTTVGDVLLVTEDMVNNGIVVVEKAKYNSIIIPGTLGADVLLKTVKADEIVVEGGADYTVTLYRCDIDKVDVNAVEIDSVTVEELTAALNVEGANAEEVIAQFVAREEAKKAAATAQVKLNTTFFTTVKDINVKASAKIDANDCEVENINLAMADAKERLNVTVVDHNGAMSVNLDRAEGAAAAYCMLDVKNSNVASISVSGDDSSCFIEGTNAEADVINVSGATKITLNLDADKVVVDENTANAKVRVYSAVDEVVVKGDANSIVLPTSGEIGNAVVEGTNVKVYGYGDLTSAVVTGAGANVAIHGSTVEGANDYSFPSEMIAMNPYKDVESNKGTAYVPPVEPEPSGPIHTFTYDADTPQPKYSFLIKDYIPDYQSGEEVKITATFSSNSWYGGGIGGNDLNDGWIQKQYSNDTNNEVTLNIVEKYDGNGNIDISVWWWGADPATQEINIESITVERVEVDNSPKEVTYKASELTLGGYGHLTREVNDDGSVTATFDANSYYEISFTLPEGYSLTEYDKIVVEMSTTAGVFVKTWDVDPLPGQWGDVAYQEKWTSTTSDVEVNLRDVNVKEYTEAGVSYETLTLNKVSVMTLQAETEVTVKSIKLIPAAE